MVIGPAGTQKWAQIQALRAIANMVEVDEGTFRQLLSAREHPTIIGAESGALWFKKRIYLTSYDGFIFLLRTPKVLDFQEEAPIAFYVEAKSANIPFI